MNRSKSSVYERMQNDEELFWLCFGALYITEMRRTHGDHKSPSLNIKSSGLATTWYNLCKKHGILTENPRIREKNGVYLFYCTIYSLYKLLSVVKKLPETKMDVDVRKSIKDFTYSYSFLKLNRITIKILKVLTNASCTTNELARKVNYNSGNFFKKYLDSLQKHGLIKRIKQGRQLVVNIITPSGKEFIEKHENEIENVPKYSLYQKCFEDKQLAADLLLVTSELEMGGIMQNAPYLQMTSKDFVEFIRKVCRKWGWTHHSKIYERSVSNYSTQYRIPLNSKVSREIYNLSGPCADINKDKEYNHAINLKSGGSHRKINQTKNEIIHLVSNGVNTSKDIAFSIKIGIQSVQRPLNQLVEENVLIRNRIGNKFYYGFTKK